MQGILVALIAALSLSLVGYEQQPTISIPMQQLVIASEAEPVVSSTAEPSSSWDTGSSNLESNVVSEEEKRIPNTDGTYDPPEIIELPEYIWTYQQKMYDFHTFCDANMNDDVYGGYSIEGDVTVLLYLDLEKVKAVAEQYVPDWEDRGTKYVEDAVQVEYRKAQYSMRFLKQVKEELAKELIKQGIDDHPDGRLGIHDNGLTISMWEEEIPQMEKFLKTYKHKDCVRIHNMSAALIPNT